MQLDQLSWSKALDRHGIVTREEDEDDDDLGLEAEVRDELEHQV